MSIMLSQSALLGAIESGLIYSFVALGIYISFRILDFPDLTVEGTFPLGAAIAVSLIIAGINPWLASIAAIIAGMFFGTLTAVLYLIGRVPKLLASILTGTSLYSINLHILGGANLPLMSSETIFTGFSNLPFFNGDMTYSKIALLLLLAIFCGILLWRYLESDNGLAMRATGLNLRMSQAQGINCAKQIIIGMAMSNGLVAFAGALYSQVNFYADSSLGIGTIILGLAAVIIGEAILPWRFMLLALLGCILGSIIYWIAIAYALNSVSFISPFDLNLITALLIACVLIFANKFAKSNK